MLKKDNYLPNQGYLIPKKDVNTNDQIFIISYRQLENISQTLNKLQKKNTNYVTQICYTFNNIRKAHFVRTLIIYIYIYINNKAKLLSMPK